MTDTIASIYIPMHNNSGEYYDESMLRKVQSMIMGQFGGVTFVQNNIGLWLSQRGHVYQDAITIAQFAITSNAGTVAQVAQIGHNIRTMLEQEAVFLTFQTVDARLV